MPHSELAAFCSKLETFPTVISKLSLLSMRSNARLFSARFKLNCGRCSTSSREALTSQVQMQRDNGQRLAMAARCHADDCISPLIRVTR